MQMNRREILKALGFAVAASPFAGALEVEAKPDFTGYIGFDYDPVNPLHIPPDVLAGINGRLDTEIAWKRVAIWGEPDTHNLAKIHDDGWRVCKANFPYLGDHYTGPYDHIEVGGLQLMYRKRQDLPKRPAMVAIIPDSYARDGTPLIKRLQIG